MQHVQKVDSVDGVRAIRWEEGALILLDQRRLPGEVEYLRLETSDEVAEAIAAMIVRGAPAIGIAAAWGVVLAVREAMSGRESGWRERIQAPLERLRYSRPTAVNLAWAMNRMQTVLAGSDEQMPARLEAEAAAIHREDIEANRTMGKLGAAWLTDGKAVLTHCNTGSLATGGYGTALGVIRTAWSEGRIEQVYVSETRPWLQGARLTAWELQQDDIPATLIADSAAAWLMRSGRIGWVITGADRITANGDVANKIGTYAHAVNARHHGLGMMVAAPVSTIDLATATGEDIEIEQRSAEEVTIIGGRRIAPDDVRAYNPVFDVTPAQLVSVLVTEAGCVATPDRDGIARLLQEKNP